MTKNATLQNHVIEKTFETFEPKHYLKTYYSAIGSENYGLLDFFSKAFQDIKKDSVMLEFGGGPTVYQLISAAPKVKTIHFADYLDKNLDEVRLWKSNVKGAFNWDKFIKKALLLEGNKTVTKKQVISRKELARKKITRLLHCDAFKTDPMGQKYRNYYDIVNINFVTESITDKKEIWEKLVMNVCSMLKKGGIFIMTAIKEAEYYHVGKRKFPAANITEDDIIELLTKLKFEETNFILDSISAEIEEGVIGYTGYKGIIFLKAKK